MFYYTEVASRIVMSMASRVKVLPLVTLWLLVRDPVAIKVFEALVKAQWEAVPVAVTLPVVIAGTTTLRPSVLPLVGEPTVMEVLFPRV
jgi:hypothetical protein